jgi:GNAT superfamily N-acetyltransferase
MKIRPASPSDISLIFSFLQKKAKFDRTIGAFSGVLQTNKEKIRKTLFGAVPFAFVLFVENAEGAIRFALYGFRYSSFAGQPSIWLDDLYVDESARSCGAGTALMSDLAQVARDNNCTHIAWNADARNLRGISFYRRLGATVVKQDGNRCFLKWIQQKEAYDR